MDRSESRATDEALAPDPRAAALLELGACAAHGEVVVAGRHIHLAQGEVGDVLGAQDDASLAVFLRESGRVAEDWLQRHADVGDERRLEAELERDGVLGENDLRALRRALWIDRIAAALDDAARSGEDAPRLGAPPAGMRQGRGSRLAPLVLDALARLATDRAAEEVGARLTHRLRWSGSVHEAQARTWAAFGDVPEHPAVASVLARRPAAASRIAALVRAGLLELDAPGESILVPAPSADALPPPLPRRSLVPTARPLPISMPRASLPPARMPRLRLDPGAAEVIDEPLAPTPLRTFAVTGAAWDDPLWNTERDIAALEAQGAPGPARAQAFRALATAWRQRLGSLDEAARAYREAVAADPTDATLLVETAACCLAAGDAKLARQYADVAVNAAATPALRATARRLRARLHATLGQLDACVEELCEAVADDPSDVESHELVAAILAARADAAGANAHLRLAAAGHGAGPRALALLRHAAELRPDHIATAQELAAALVHAGHASAANVVWLHAARLQRVPAARRRLRSTAAEYASAHGRPDLAADALEEAFDESPGLDALHEPLDAALHAANLAADRVALLEEIAASATGTARALWLTAAAEVLLRIDGQLETALRLAHAALRAQPDAPAALALLRTHAASDWGLAALAHGLRGAAAACAGTDADQAAALLEELAWLADERLVDPGLAHWAWTRVSELGRGNPRVQSTLERLARRVSDGHAVDTLAALLTEGDDPVALAARLEADADESRLPDERRHALDRLASLHALHGDAHATAAACERLLALWPDHALAAARWERAARRLRDPAQLGRALQTQATQAEASPTATPIARARVLARWGAHLDAVGDVDAALVVAARALRLDPPDARAADLVLRHADRLAASDAPALLELAQSALGVSRAVLLARASAAQAVDDRPAQRAALQTWCALLPCDPEAARALLACERDGDDHAAVEHAAERVLDGLPGREVLTAAGDAVDRLLARGANEEGLRVLLRVGQALGRSGGPLAARALELAKGMSTPVAIQALEWAAAQPDAPTHAEALAELARLHRERGDALGETRALQRLLLATPERSDVFERLEALWVARGARARLAQLYAFDAERAVTPEARTRRLVDLVAACADDPELAATHVRTLIIEQASDLAAVRSAAGLLFSLGDKRWAIAHCDAIAVDCPGDAGGKLALWTVMTAEYVLVDSVLARELAMRGARRFPNEAGLLLLAERLALDAQDVAGALATYDALLGAAIGPHGRRTLQYRAGRWLESAGRPREAMARLLEAFALAPSMGVIYRAAERLAEAAGDHRALERLHTTLAAATRDVALRFSLTRRVASLLLDRLDEPERGYAMLLEANALSERFELDEELRERARTLVRANAPTALSALEGLRAHWEERVESLWEARARIDCLRKLAVLLADDFADTAGALVCLERATAIAAEEQVEELPRADLERELAALRARCAAAGGEPPARRSYAGVALGARPSRASVAGARAPASPAALTAASALADTLEDLVAAVCAEPWRVDLLRRLQALEAPASPAVGIVVNALLSVIDGGADSGTSTDFTAAWRGVALDEILGPTYPDALGNLLSLLWQRARVLPRFRIALEAYGVSTRDRLTRLSMGFVSDAYTDAAQALGILVAVYTSDTAAQPVRALPTYPTSLVCTPHLGGIASERAYLLAHALWLTRGEHVIAALLDEPDARLLLDAFVAAFGASRPRAMPDRERKELAAQFWQTIPARDQQTLSALVRAHGAQLDYPTLRAAAYAAAARAGLLVCGDARVALRATLTEAGVGDGPLDASAFETACRASASVAEVVRCALSPAFLDATARSRGMV